MYWSLLKIYEKTWVNMKNNFNITATLKTNLFTQSFKKTINQKYCIDVTVVLGSK